VLSEKAHVPQVITSNSSVIMISTDCFKCDVNGQPSLGGHLVLKAKSPCYKRQIFYPKMNFSRFVEILGCLPKNQNFLNTVHSVNTSAQNGILIITNKMVASNKRGEVSIDTIYFTCS
jgi:hypothetical protein